MLTPSDPDKKCPSPQTSVSFDEMRRRLRKNLQELEQVVASGYLKYLSPEMSRRIMAIVEEQPRP